MSVPLPRWRLHLASSAPMPKHLKVRTMHSIHCQNSPLIFFYLFESLTFAKGKGNQPQAAASAAGGDEATLDLTQYEK